MPPFTPEIFAQDGPEVSSGDFVDLGFVPRALTMAPAPPRDVRLFLLSFAEGIWRIDWRDVGPFSGESRSLSPVSDWQISTTPVGRINAEGSQLDWAGDCLAAGTILRTVSSQGSGKMMSYTHNGGSFKDIYVQIFGFSQQSGLSGRPSQPLRLTLSTDDATVPDECQSVGLGTEIVLADNGLFYYDLLCQYQPPPVTTNFDGVQLYVGGWSGVSLVEFGSLGTWDRVSRLQDFKVRIPEDSGLAVSVGHFTNGSAAVTRVSGTNFDAAWNGRKVSIKSGGAGVVKTINTATTINAMTLTSNWTGTTGDYSIIVYNQTSYYFVPVGPTGTRRPDPTGTPNVIVQ